MSVESKGPSAAVIGAGISGLACTRELAAHGLETAVFDKGRDVGGRMSVRRRPHGDFDHGAQYFTARDERFQDVVQGWIEEGVVAEWRGRIGAWDGVSLRRKDGDTVRYVGAPGMSACCKRLAEGLRVANRCRVGFVGRSGDRWAVSDEEGRALGEYDWVVAATPPSQANELVGAQAGFAERLTAVEMHPCWAVMAAFEQPVAIGFDGVFVNDGPLSWAARSSAKPGRDPAPDRWVLHASPAWSRTNLERRPEAVAEELLRAFAKLAGETPTLHAEPEAHRWRFALAAEPLEDGCLLDAEARLAACGDWSNGSRVEGAYLSGLAAAEAIIARVRSSRESPSPAAR